MLYHSHGKRWPSAIQINPIGALNLSSLVIDEVLRKNVRSPYRASIRGMFGQIYLRQGNIFTLRLNPNGEGRLVGYRLCLKNL